MSRAPDDPVLDPARLAAVEATGLLDTDAEEPFDRLTRLASSILETPMAFMTLVDDQRSFWKSRLGVPADVVQNTVDESFCQYVVSSGEGLVAGDAATHPTTRDNPSVDGMGVAAWAGFPVRSPDGLVLGSFCVVDTEPRTFRADQVEALATLAEAASAEIALRLTVADLNDVTDVLRESLLPPTLPDVAGVDLASRHRPAADGAGVLGDFYDAFEANGRWWLPLGDVCGHGPPAVKTTGLARWSIRANAARSSAPAPVLRRLNHQLVSRPEASAPHVTAVLATLLPPEGPGPLDVDVAVSGHPPPRVVRADGEVTALDAWGTALGFFEEVEVGQAQVRLAGGDALVLFTDGVLEARDEDSAFGEEGLDRVLSTLAGASAEAVAEGVLDAAARHGSGLRDDMAVVVIRNPA